MKCQRCTGLMVPERPLQSFNLADAALTDFSLIQLPARRCICCGNVEDPVVLRNRSGRVLQEVG